MAPAGGRARSLVMARRLSEEATYPYEDAYTYGTYEDAAPQGGAAPPLSDGEVAGIAVGAIAAVVLLVICLVVFYFFRRSAALENEIAAKAGSSKDLPELRHGGVLRVRLHRARGLKNADSDGLSDPFVKLYLGEEGIFNHHEHHRSKTIQNTLNPEWDETFEFHTHGLLSDGPLRALLQNVLLVLSSLLCLFAAPPSLQCLHRVQSCIRLLLQLGV